jgi:hypothetical protein
MTDHSRIRGARENAETVKSMISSLDAAGQGSLAEPLALLADAILDLYREIDRISTLILAGE